MLEFTKRFINDESGQDMAEYGLLLAIIGVALVAAIAAFRGQIANLFNRAGEALEGSEEQ